MTSLYALFRSTLFYLQTMVAVIIYAFPLRRRDRLAVRLPLALLVGCSVCFLTGFYLYPSSYGLVQAFERLLCYSIFYLMVFLTVHTILHVSWWTALFVASAAYTSQNIAGTCKEIAKSLPPVQAFASRTLGEPLLDLAFYIPIYLILYCVFHDAVLHSEEDRDNPLKAVFAFVTLLICMGMARITGDNPDRNLLAQTAERIYSVLAGILLLLVQYRTLEQRKLDRNIDTMRELMHQQQLQFNTSKESAQLVNEKYHDLKQMISTLSGRISAQELQNLQESIASYDTAAHTGNEVLDVILTEKSMLCDKNGIAITCMVRGVDFGFMEELDLYSLFSNALTNAISAVSSLPADIARTITVTSQQDGNVIFLHWENPCNDGIAFENGLPKTRGDPRYHGFGMQSMLRIVQKYNGTLAAKQSSGMFYLDIVLVSPN